MKEYFFLDLKKTSITSNIYLYITNSTLKQILYTQINYLTSIMTLVSLSVKFWSILSIDTQLVSDLLEEVSRQQFTTPHQDVLFQRSRFWIGPAVRVLLANHIPPWGSTHADTSNADHVALTANNPCSSYMLPSHVQWSNSFLDKQTERWWLCYW